MSPERSSSTATTVPARSRSWLQRACATLATVCVPLSLGVACRPAAADGQPVPATGSVAEASTPAAGPAATGPVKVRLSWDASPDRDVAGYKVSWGDMPGRYTESTSLSGPASSVELSLPARPAPYFVAVQARSGGGQVSGYSNEFVLDLSSGTPRAVSVDKGGAGQSQVKKPKERKPKKNKADAAERKRKKQEAKEAKKAKRQKAQTPP